MQTTTTFLETKPSHHLGFITTTVIVTSGQCSNVSDAVGLRDRNNNVDAAGEDQICGRPRDGNGPVPDLVPDVNRLKLQIPKINQLNWSGEPAKMIRSENLTEYCGPVRSKDRLTICFDKWVILYGKMRDDT